MKIGIFLSRFYFAVSKFNPNQNYYKILGLSNKADSTDIKKAFKKLAKQYHPDRNQGTEEKFKEVNEAYQVLSDQTTRK